MAGTRNAARPHPGAILRDRILPGLDLSVSQAIQERRGARQALHRVLAGMVDVTHEMATRLARPSGTTPQFWLTLQQRHDLWHAVRTLPGELYLVPAHALSAAIQWEIELRHDR